MSMIQITSTGNETIKHVRSLKQCKYRKQYNEHLIEGYKLVEEAIKTGLQIKLIITDNPDIDNLYPNANIILTSKEILSSICDCITPQGICAVVDTTSIPSDTAITGNFWVALDTIQDPGNLGAIIRSSDAFGVNGILLGQGCCDPFSMKCIRSTMGSIYHIPIIRCSLEEILPQLQDKGYSCVCGHLKGSEHLPDSMNKVILVIGNEGNGVSERIAAHCYKYKIPMYGKAESLNAAVAASILIYDYSKVLKAI